MLIAINTAAVYVDYFRFEDACYDSGIPFFGEHVF